jgi:hypothetical protein
LNGCATIDPEPRACKWVQGDPNGASPVRLCPLEARDLTGDAPRNGLELRRVGGIGGSDTFVSARMLDKGAKRVADRVYVARLAPGVVFRLGQEGAAGIDHRARRLIHRVRCFLPLQPGQRYAILEQ